MSELTTAERCEAILKKMLELANDDRPVRLVEDFGENTATICAGRGHTHVGVPGGTWELFVENLYNALHGGPGLSWHDPEVPHA